MFSCTLLTPGKKNEVLVTDGVAITATLYSGDSCKRGVMTAILWRLILPEGKLSFKPIPLPSDFICGSVVNYWTPSPSPLKLISVSLHRIPPPLPYGSLVFFQPVVSRFKNETLLRL